MKQSFKEKVVEQIANNLYSIILETVIMLLIAGYAIYEIRDVKQDVTEKVNHSHEALASYSKEQSEKLSVVTDELSRTTELLASIVGITVDDFKENRSEIYKKVGEGSKAAFKDYLKAKFGNKDELEATSEDTQ